MKQTIACILASAAALTMTALPVAAATPADSTAGIEFAAGPLEPGGPDVDVDGVIKNLNFYFGSQQISSSTETYDSVNNEEENSPYDGMGEKVGYIVTNNTGSADEGWEVTVEISDFTVGGAPAMQGFTLTMTPEANYPKPSDETSTIGNLAPVANTIDLIADDESAEVLFHAAAGQGRGTWGANWTGKLEVLGGTAKAGNAKATMTWNLQAV